MSIFSLQRLSITNFRAVKSLEIEFAERPGLYFVVGQNQVAPSLGSNGASKSTIFVDSILWALYGVVTRDNRPGADIETWGVEGTTGVVVEFMLDGEEHTVERCRKPSKLLLDGGRVEQREIDKLLPLNSVVLRRTLVIDQFSGLFLSLPPERKSQMFTETLHLDTWIRGSDLAAEMATETEKEIVSTDLKIAGFDASIAEVKDQLEITRKKAVEFDGERTIKLTQLRGDRTRLAAAVALSEQALNKARAKWPEGQDDKKVLQNDKRREEQRILHTSGTAKERRDSMARARVRMFERLQSYQNTETCPECGQAVTPEHIEQKRKELEAEIAEHDRVYDELLKQTEGLGSGLLTVQGEIEALDRQLTEFNQVQTEVAQWAGKNLAEQRELHGLDRQITELANQKNTFAEHVTILEERLESLKDSRETEKQKRQDLRREADIYKFWQRGFREIRLEQIDATLVELELAANRHAQSLGLNDWGIQFSTERETQKGAISHVFNVTLFPPGQTTPISWESYSGGESQRWQLAVTFALAEVLLARSGLDTDFEFFDEITQHLSSEGIEDLVVCLRERALELGRRIYMIDHHALERGAFDGVYTVTKTAEAVSVAYN